MSMERTTSTSAGGDRLLSTPPSTIRVSEWERLIAAVLEADSILVTEVSGVIIWANETFMRSTGYSLEEVIGRNPRLLKSGRHGHSFYKDLWTTVMDGRSWHGQIADRMKDGTICVEDTTVIPLLSDTGSITHFVAIMRSNAPHPDAGDAVLESVVPLMTELKDVTAALEHARSQMSAILDAASDAMMLLSSNDEIVWVNRAFAYFFGLKTTDITGSQFRKFDLHWQKVFENPQEATPLIQVSDNRLMSKDRQSIAQCWPQKRELDLHRARVENANREYLGDLFVFRDVTREREVERMKSEFVSLVSHEFRTPLTSIKGYAEMMLDGDSGTLSAEQTDYLSTIHRNAAHLAEIVNDLLEVSRLEAGAVKLTHEVLVLPSLIEGVADSLRPQISSKRQKLVIKVPPKLPEVVGDNKRISQVITNLLSNAHKYTPAGGAITITLKARGGFVEVDVADTGIGISAEDQKKLFTRFFRVESETGVKVGGTGLGLWISRSFAEMHGGALTVASKPGRGSTFTLTLPAKE